MITPPRSLYVHVPFCAHRCGYCDFVTTSRSPELHGRYVAALRRELELQGGAPDAGFDTIFVGGGTPTLLEAPAMAELLRWLDEVRAPGAEVTIECNPETVDGRLAGQLAGSVSRVSLGAQSFSPHVLATLERRADPDTVRSAVRQLRDAGIDRLSLDLIWAVPGQTDDDLARDLDAALALEPDHLSAYELELKPGTRLAHRFGVDAATALGEAADDHYDFLIDRLEGAGWWWYETANFARTEAERCRHNLAYWNADSWLAVGVGAVGARPGSDAGSIVRRANLPNVPRWLAAVEEGALPPARVEEVDARTARIERVMLALRLDQQVRIAASDIADSIVDGAGLERVVELELGSATPVADDDGVLRGDVALRLNRRGRMLQGTVGGLLLDP